MKIVKKICVKLTDVGNMTYLSVLLVAGDDQNETQSRIVYLEGDWSHS